MVKELIFTTKGHINLEDLTYRNGFDWQPNGVTFWEEHLLGDEVVKRSAHGYILPVGTKLELDGGTLG